MKTISENRANTVKLLERTEQNQFDLKLGKYFCNTTAKT